MDTPALNPKNLLALPQEELWAELGKAVRVGKLGLLQKEEEAEYRDAALGKNFFTRQLENTRKIICHEKIVQTLTNEARKDVVVFVASLIDLISSYYGHVPGTILLVQVFKIGVHRFCDGNCDIAKPAAVIG